MSTEVAFDPFAGPAILATAPTTDAQREIWTAARLGDEASLAFNESASLRLAGELDLDALRASLQDLVARHEALRSTFGADGMTMIVSAPSEIALPLHDLGELDEAEAGRRTSALLAREVETPFDLERGPLVRVHAVRRAPEDHLVVFTAHHIVCDGWSAAVLMKDWAALYTARRLGKEAGLPPADRFTAYAAEQAQAAGSAPRRADEAWWVSRFAGEVPVLDLPTDGRRPALKTYASRREDAVLPAELVQRVRRMGAKDGASLFATLLAGFDLLLHRLSGQDDLVVGIPAAGQAGGGHASLVGHCVHTLPLRTRVEPEQPFRALLRAVRGTVLDAYEHQEVTLGSLLQRLALPRDPGRLPLVSVCFNLDQGLAQDALPFAGLRASFAGNPRRFENFDLFVNAVEAEGAVTLECQYNADLFQAATVRRWMEAYATLLSAVADAPEQPVAEVPVVTAAEREAFKEWNRTESEYPRTRCVHELVSEEAARRPGAVAVEFEGRTLTYGELESRSNRLARYLRKKGVAPAVRVGLCLERSPELLVALLGVLKAGGAYVPLDPGYPAERLRFMIEDAAIPVLVTSSAVHDVPAGEAVERVLLDGDWPAVAAESDAPLTGGGARPEDAAYVIYTSGSTGRPKGVLVPHRSVVNLLWSVLDVPGMGENDVVLAITTLSFDIAVSELVLPLVAGARIVMVGRDTAADGLRLLATIRERRVTFVDATPATWRLLVAAGWEGGEGLTAICTGEAMPRDLAEELVLRCRRVWNGYGPTETTVWSTFWEVPPRLERVLIGRPVRNTRLHILDRGGRPVPVGVAGELCIAGDGVTLGYLNRPELTRERFVAEPGGPEGARMYRTGDLARWRSDGQVECLGRNDHQVKVRGFRIELGEIEAALAAHASVEQAVATVREDRPGDVRLVAYVVPADGLAPEAEALRGHLGRTLPEFMVPQVFVPVSSLPLTPSGKVDRNRLPAPPDLAGAADAYVAPRTGAEAMVAELWQEALAVARLGVHDNFFHLGGHSLLASQVLSALARRHGITLPFRKMFEAPTVAEFARLVEGASAEPPTAAPPRIARRAGGGPAPASLLQTRIWLMEEMDPGQRLVHSVSSIFRLRGRLDVPALARAVDAIVARHETLRTTFRHEASGLVQVVAEPAEVPLPALDFTAHPEAERLDRMIEHFRGVVRTPFDLRTGPLFQAVLARLGEEDHALVFRAHTSVWDGWSFDVFRHELAALYAAFAEGRPSPLPELPIAYGDFAEWQRGWLESKEMRGQEEYWRGALAGDLPVLDLPTDRPRPAERTWTGADEPVALTAEEVEPLRAAARAADATLFMALLAVFDVLLWQRSGQQELVVATPVRARQVPEMEGLIGPFVNAVALRTRLAPQATFLEYLKHVRDVTLDAFSHQDLPFERLGAQTPVLRAFFSLQDVRQRETRLGALDLTQLRVGAPGASADLTFWLMEGREGLTGALNYACELFEPDSVRRLVAQYRRLVRTLGADPRQRLADVSLASDEERRVVEAWSAPPAANGGEPLPARIAAHARRDPERPAVRGGGAVLSRGGLQARARALAARLAQAAARPGDVVGLCLEPGPDRVAALLAILDSGACCLPLDPGDGRGRTARLIAEAGARHVVTDARLAEDLPPTVVCVPVEDAPPAAAAEGPALIAPEAPALVAWGADDAGRLPPTVVSHAAAASQVEALARAFRPLAEDEDLVSLSPWSSPSGPLEALLALAAGATLVVPADGPPEPAAVFAGPADALRSALEGVREGARPEAWCLGEPVTPRAAAALLPLCSALRSAAGWPEARAWGLVQDVKEVPTRTVLGRPAAGALVRILDERGTACPIGVPGALVVGGERLVWTGARGRWRADGAVELWGAHAWRAGRPFRPAEVEAALRAHPSVGDAAAALEEGPDGEGVVAYLVAAARGELALADLRKHVRRELPEALVPRRFVELAAIPRTANGALDARRLPSRRDHADGSPRTAAERLLAGLWQEALGVERVSLHDNFFELGGHSLLCLDVLARLEKSTGARLSPRALLLDTLEQVAARMPEAMP